MLVDHFDSGIPDEALLSAVGARGWAFLSKDRNIRRRPLERQALLNAGVRAFLLTTADVGGRGRSCSPRLRRTTFGPVYFMAMRPVVGGPSVLVVSSSLNPASRSHRLALSAAEALDGIGVPRDLLDLRVWDLPICDGDSCYDHPAIGPLTERVAAAAAVLIASPVYNYDLNAAVKNLVELTGSAWEAKAVGFLCAAGGERSYMSPIGFANSLMFDYRCHIIPRYVYATKDDFTAARDPSDELAGRIRQLARAAVDLASALRWIAGRKQEQA